MTKILDAVFDGEVLRLDDKTGLQPNTRYRITIEQAETPETSGEPTYPLTALLELATDMQVIDLAAEHDKYAHGKLEEHDNSVG